MNNPELDVKVVVKNTPDKLDAGWLVVRDTRDALWYYGRYEDEDKARFIAEDIGNGIVFKYLG